MRVNVFFARNCTSYVSVRAQIKGVNSLVVNSTAAKPRTCPCAHSKSSGPSMPLLPPIAGVLLILPCVDAAFSFSIPPPHVKSPRTVCSRHGLRPGKIPHGLRESPPIRGSLALSASATSGDHQNENLYENSPLLQVLVAVAAVPLTAALGFLYSKALSASAKGLWTVLPAALSRKGISINPVLFITSITSLGGLIMGLLSAKFQSAFSVVSAFSVPEDRSSIFLVLVISLVTSVFGFSVGPEATMVGAAALVGVSLARLLSGKPNSSMVANLGYVGAIAGLTAFMDIPIAWSIFALELTRSSSGLSSRAPSPTVAACVASLVVIRTVLLPRKDFGGQFAYGAAVRAANGRSMMTAALASGVGGAVLGTIFRESVAALTEMLWPVTEEQDIVKREILVKTSIGMLVGLLSSFYPQTMFWGEGSLQCVIDGQKTAFASTKHGLPAILTSAAWVNPNRPFNGASAALQVGIAKFVAIILACAGKFPGGIIFPLFFAAAPFAHACSSFVGPSVLPIMVMCLMASTQSSVTRKPLATTMILCLSASASSELSVMLPACMVASYTGVWVAQFLSSKSYFKYSRRRPLSS